MTPDDFRQSLAAANPPAELTLALSGLWWDAKGDWTRAHESAQQDGGVEGGDVGSVEDGIAQALQPSEGSLLNDSTNCHFVDRARIAAVAAVGGGAIEVSVAAKDGSHHRIYSIGTTGEIATSSSSS